MAKIVVLGSNGQLGYDLMKVLHNNTNNQVIAATREQIDATTAKANDLARYADSDYIINCIATTNVDACEDNPSNAFSINTTFVVELAKFCTANNITLIHISTDYVFDGTNKQPYTETDVPRPLNVYGLSKYAGELAIGHYGDKYFILRVSSLFGVAGASGKGGNFVTTMLRLSQEKDSWTVINDQITCPTHTLDIARAINALIEQKATEYGIYNCVSSTSCSWFEFTQDILCQSGNDINKVQPISYRNYSFKATRPQYGVMSVDKLARFYAMPDYKSALAEYLTIKNKQAILRSN